MDLIRPLDAKQYEMAVDKLIAVRRVANQGLTHVTSAPSASILANYFIWTSCTIQHAASNFSLSSLLSSRTSFPLMTST